MEIPFIVFIALSLAADCFAVALGAGIIRYQKSLVKLLRISLSFGLFQFLMTILGWYLGKFFVSFISIYDHWLAFGLLTFVGDRMIWEFFEKGQNEGKDKYRDISKGFLLITMSFATSIDALAVGLSLAFLDSNIVIAATIIGIVSLALSAIGFWLGGKLNIIFGKAAQLVGGVILLSIGIKILIEHLLLV